MPLCHNVEKEKIMINTLKNRFFEHMERHPDVKWEDVEKRLDEKTLKILANMEEPDTIGYDDNGKLIYCDCCKESPMRRSLCYDDEALRKRKNNPPSGSAMAQAKELGLELMDESLYRRLQETGEYDLKTSSWIRTPEDIRNKGGALFCERRYDVVFVFHNGADSYYGARGWRGYICI